LDEIIVICPSNKLCQQAADAFRTRGLPAAVREAEYRMTQVTSFVEGCATWAVLGRELSNYRLSGLLGQWRAILGPRWDRQADVSLTTLLLGYADKADEPARLLLKALLDLGLRSALTHPALADEATQMTRMQQALTTGDLQGLTTLGLTERARKADRVEVTTMTSSKGLEFDVVLILGVDEKRVPDFRSEGDPEKLLEDKRKFYVSITRARDEVKIFYSGFVEWASGKRSYAGPSRFLKQIGLA
jgi:DNA helicase II / ATP-dependent DNA helicase PcrA